MSITNTVSSLTTIIRGLIKDRIRNDGNDIAEYIGDNSFNVSEMFPDSTSFVVYQNGSVVDTQDYTYNADTNQIVIVFVTSGSAFNDDDLIRTTYNYYCKYSDTEIKGFLLSSLSYFVQHRYNKIFDINSDDEIVTINGIQPTIEELYFIALIASILIDPQNITVKDGEFRITANRDTSDQEQISNAFRQFKRFVGTVSFEKILNFDSDRRF